MRKRYIVQASKKQIRKIKVLKKLDLARNVRGNKKGFCIYAGNKRRIGQNFGPFRKEMVDLTPWGMEKI